MSQSNYKYSRDVINIFYDEMEYCLIRMISYTFFLSICVKVLEMRINLSKYSFLIKPWYVKCLKFYELS